MSKQSKQKLPAQTVVLRALAELLRAVIQTSVDHDADPNEDSERAFGVAYSALKAFIADSGLEIELQEWPDNLYHLVYDGEIKIPEYKPRRKAPIFDHGIADGDTVYLKGGDVPLTVVVTERHAVYVKNPMGSTHWFDADKVTLEAPAQEALHK